MPAAISDPALPSSGSPCSVLPFHTSGFFSPLWFSAHCTPCAHLSQKESRLPALGVPAVFPLQQLGPSPSSAVRPQLRPQLQLQDATRPRHLLCATKPRYSHAQKIKLCIFFPATHLASFPKGLRGTEQGLQLSPHSSAGSCPHYRGRKGRDHSWVSDLLAEAAQTHIKLLRAHPAPAQHHLQGKGTARELLCAALPARHADKGAPRAASGHFLPAYPPFFVPKVKKRSWVGCL